MKNFKRVLSLALAVMMVIGGLAIAPMDAKAASDYTKVNSVSEITEEGNYVIIATNSNGSFAMGTNLNTSSGYLYAVEVTVGAEGITSESSVPVWTITPGTNGMTLKSSDGFLNASAAKKVNYSETDTEASQIWTIADGTEAGTMTIQSTAFEAATGGMMAFNYNGGDAPRFKTYASNYTSGVTEFTVYKYNGSLTPPPQDIELDADATPEEIVNAAYEAMRTGVDLLGTWSLTGVITNISDAYTGGTDYKNVAITIQVGDMTDKLIGGYRVTVEDTNDEEALAMLQNLGVGDTVKLTGTIGYHNTTVQFVQGSIIELVEKAAVVIPDIELEADATPEEIVNAAYEAMRTGVDLLGTWSLTGVITNISDAYTGGTDYKNVAITIQVGDMTDKLIGGYRVTVEDTNDEEALAMLQNLEIGDTVKLTGTIGYYNTTVQFVQGSIIELVEKGELPDTLPQTATPEEIVEAAYAAMESNGAMIGTYTLTGVISSIDTEWSDQYGNITVTMIVGDMTENPIQCFRLAVAEDASDALKEAIKALAVGDTITVKGTFGYYNGKVQYAQGSVLTAVNEIVEEAPDTGECSLIGAYAVLAVSALALVVVEFKKRR